MGLLLAGCAATAPSIKTTYLGSGTPVPRPDTARVEVFFQPPARPHATIGEVEITGEFTAEEASREETLARARRAARQMGGDALIVEDQFLSMPGTKAPRYDRATGQTIYIDEGPSAGILKVAVIVWK
jgi:hypothetical protein